MVPDKNEYGDGGERLWVAVDFRLLTSLLLQPLDRTYISKFQMLEMRLV